MRIALFGLVGGCLLPPTAGATTGIGSLLNGPSNGFESCFACTFSALDIPAAEDAAGGATAPTDGVVVRWRIKVGINNTTTALRITRPGNSATRVGAGTSAPVIPPKMATTTFATRLSVRAGDALGIDMSGGGSYFSNGSATKRILWEGPALADGGTPRLAATPGQSLLQVNADIEADIDRDGFRDETQDLCPAEASLQVSCPFRLDVKVDGAGSVTGPAIACPGDCTSFYAAGQSVTLTPVETVEGVSFSGFGGDCVSLTPTSCTLTMSANRTATATFADLRPPQTEITKRPKKVSDKPRVTFSFKSDENGSRFQCALDKKKFRGCKTPLNFRVKKGKHALRVRAIDASGNIDPTPAKVKFKITS